MTNTLCIFFNFCKDIRQAFLCAFSATTNAQKHAKLLIYNKIHITTIIGATHGAKSPFKTRSNHFSTRKIAGGLSLP